jgi:hypothetical protein
MTMPSFDRSARSEGEVESLELLARITGNGVRTIVVETANRFACEVVSILRGGAGLSHS